MSVSKTYEDSILREAYAFFNGVSQQRRLEAPIFPAFATTMLAEMDLAQAAQHAANPDYTVPMVTAGLTLLTAIISGSLLPL